MSQVTLQKTQHRNIQRRTKPNNTHPAQNNAEQNRTNPGPQTWKFFTEASLTLPLKLRHQHRRPSFQCGALFFSPTPGSSGGGGGGAAGAGAVEGPAPLAPEVCIIPSRSIRRPTRLPAGRRSLPSALPSTDPGAPGPGGAGDPGSEGPPPSASSMLLLVRPAGPQGVPAESAAPPAPVRRTVAVQGSPPQSPAKLPQLAAEEGLPAPPPPSMPLGRPEPDWDCGVGVRTSCGRPWWKESWLGWGSSTFILQDRQRGGVGGGGAEGRRCQPEQQEDGSKAAGGARGPAAARQCL